MKRVLIVKVTSLGDIVQALPVVADIKRAFPGVQVDWAADEAFAELVHWSESVDRVLCAPLRRFKKARRWSDFKAIWASIAELRAYRYDFIIDIHGVYKSAIIAFLARSSRRIGYQSRIWASGAPRSRTPAASARARKAMRGMACVSALARRSATKSKGPPLYNLRLPEPASPPFASDSAPVAALLSRHLERRQEVAGRYWVGLAANWSDAAFVWSAVGFGRRARRGRADRRAGAGRDRAAEDERDRIAQMIDACALVVGTDTGFVHLAHALQKRTVMIFVATSPSHCGVEAPYRSTSIGDGHSVPPVSAALAAIDYVHGTAQELAAQPHKAVA